MKSKKRHCLAEHGPGFHNQNAAAPDCWFVSIMTSSLSRGSGVPALQRTACLFLQKAAGAL